MHCSLCLFPNATDNNICNFQNIATAYSARRNLLFQLSSSLFGFCLGLLSTKKAHESPRDNSAVCIWLQRNVGENHKDDWKFRVLPDSIKCYNFPKSVVGSPDLNLTWREFISLESHSLMPAFLLHQVTILIIKSFILPNQCWGSYITAVACQDASYSTFTMFTGKDSCTQSWVDYLIVVRY